MGMSEERRKIFTYGTLKRGFSNHRLLEELMDSGDASFVGSYHTAERYPLVCGPYRVPFLLNLPGHGYQVHGEVYEVSERGLVRMDELEGISRGHYQRLPISVTNDDHENNEVYEVEAYFAHSSYAEELWRKNGEKGYVNYTHKEAKGYVKRIDRPQHLTFLDQISLFISSSPTHS